jgi:hypothetical protein
MVVHLVWHWQLQAAFSLLRIASGRDVHLYWQVSRSSRRGVETLSGHRLAGGGLGGRASRGAPAAQGRGQAGSLGARRAAGGCVGP